MKVHLLDEDYTWEPKKKGFTEDPNEEFSRNQRFWVMEASRSCYYDSRGRDSSYLGLFFIFRQKNGSFEL